MASIIKLKNFFRSKSKASTYKKSHFLNTMPLHKLHELLLFSEGDSIEQLLGDVKNKKILFFNDAQHKFVFNKLVSKNADLVFNYVFKNHDKAEIKSGSFSVIGDIENLPVRKNYFDYVICPFALEDSTAVSKFIRSIHPFMKNGSRMILSIRHPQLDNMLLNQNPSTTSVADTLVSKYFYLLKENHLFTEDLKEGCVNLALKQFFTDSEFDYYHDYKNTPLTLFIKAVKFVKPKSYQSHAKK